MNIYLETERLIVRDHIIDDLDSYHLLFSNKKTLYFLQDILVESLEVSKKNLIDAIEEKDKVQRTKYFFRIEDKVTKEYIGEIGYTVISFTPIGKVVHLGYFINEEFWNKGYTTEALMEVLKFAFEHNDVVRIETGCFKDNGASEKVMQKCGLIKEAEHKKYEWHIDRLKDRVEYRLLREEWELSMI